MGSTTHIMAITLCLLMAPAAGFAEQQQPGQPKQQDNRGVTSQPRRVIAEHDALSNADYTTTMDASGNALGPFPEGKVVKVRTLVSNSAGSRTTAPRTITIAAPIV